MHFDRFGDVSKLIYMGFSGDPSSSQHLTLPSPSSEHLDDDEEGDESGPLNYKEVRHHKPQQVQLSQPRISDRLTLESDTGKLNNYHHQDHHQEQQVNNQKPERNTIDNLISAVSAEYDRKEEEMKDLDRLVQDLLQEASQIPDIPYHAREDGLPFRYCPQDDIVKHRNKLGGGHHHNQQIRPNHDNKESIPPPQPMIHKFEANNNAETYKPSTDYLPRNWASPKSVQNSASTGATRDVLDGSRDLHKSSHSHHVSPSTSGYEDHLPRNWNQGGSTKPVIVELERAPIKWSTIPIIENKVDTAAGEEYRVPIIQQQSRRQDEWDFQGTPIPIQREQKQPTSTDQDWSVFNDIKKQQEELESEFSKWDHAEVSSSSAKETPRKPVKYSRSFSADNFGDRDSEDWLAKQMAKLQLKRSGSIRQQNPMMARPDGSTPAWLLELKQRNNALSKSSSNPSSGSNTMERPVEIKIQQHPSSLPSPRIEPQYVQSQHHHHSLQQQQESEKKIETHSRQQKTVMEASSSGGVSDNVDSPTPRFPACPPTPYMNRSAARRHHIDSFSQRTSPGPSGGGRIARFHSPRKPTALTSTDDESEGEDEIAKIMLNRRQEEEMKFTVDSTTHWYKPSATREETISALANREKGTFVIRNSNSFPGAFGLAIKVDEYNVRHFLIEPTRAGVRLRGSEVEPVFGSLSALVYAHTIEPLALPVKLRLPAEDNLIPTSWSQSTTSTLLKQGAACQLLFFGENNVEMLTGAEAIQRSIAKLYMAKATKINLRLSTGGLVLTDIAREKFFRQHFHLSSIIHAGVDPSARTITVGDQLRKFFGIVVSKGTHNSVLVLSEFEEGQPAVAIVSFISRVVQWRSL